MSPVVRLRSCFPLLVILAAAGGCSSPAVSSSGPGGPGGSSLDADDLGGGNGGASGGPKFMFPDGGPDGPVAAPPGPKCGEESHAAEPTPVDLLLLVDSSGSMGELAGMRSKWSMAREALTAFVRDPKSAGLGVGLQFFPGYPAEKECKAEAECGPASPLALRCHQRSVCVPAPGAPVAGVASCGSAADGDCELNEMCLPLGRCSMSGADCAGVGTPCPSGKAGDTCQARPKVCRISSNQTCTAAYDQPVVPIAALPGVAPAISSALEARYPRQGTPMGPAVRGAIAHLGAHLKANPGRRVALVLATDGLPDQFCPGNYPAPIIEAVMAAQAATPSIPTYVIGVFSQVDIMKAQPTLNQLAAAGGTGTPYVLTAMNDLSQRFQEALDKIRGTVLPCEFAIPPPKTGSLDFNKVFVHFKTAAAAAGEDVPYVGSMDRCDQARGGWYFDADPAKGGTPKRVLMCEATCRRFKNEAGAKVEIRFGCKARDIG